MPNPLQHLLDGNRAWVDQTEREHPGFFAELAKQQTPKYLWIGCSDSRVPANQLLGLAPGEVFVHRNVANVVVPSDLNALAAVQFAVDVLKVEHILVVGHYGCGGVGAVLKGQRIGLGDNWLLHVHDVKLRHEKELGKLPENQQYDALCELNVIEQARNLAETTVMQDAWARGQKTAIHGLCYRLSDGVLKDLGITYAQPKAVAEAYRGAIDHALHARA